MFLETLFNKFYISYGARLKGIRDRAHLKDNRGIGLPAEVKNPLEIRVEVVAPWCLRRCTSSFCSVK